MIVVEGLEVRDEGIIVLVALVVKSYSCSTWIELVRHVYEEYETANFGCRFDSKGALDKALEEYS